MAGRGPGCVCVHARARGGDCAQHDDSDGADAGRAAGAARSAAKARALTIVGGAERWVDAAAAQAAGYTLVDLGDGWTPFIFQEVTDGNGNLMPNRYRQVYLGLANNLGDRDGQPLVEGEHNYLELYGVPPTLSVLRARFLDSQQRTASCADVDFVKLKGAASIPPRAGKAQLKYAAKIAATTKKLEALRVRAGAESLDELAQKQPKLAKDIAEIQRYSAQTGSFPEVEKRLTCEGMLTPPPNAKPSEIHQPGQFDEPMRRGGHPLPAQAHARTTRRRCGRDTMAALGRTLARERLRGAGARPDRARRLGGEHPRGRLRRGQERARRPT